MPSDNNVPLQHKEEDINEYEEKIGRLKTIHHGILTHNITSTTTRKEDDASATTNHHHQQQKQEKGLSG